MSVNLDKRAGKSTDVCLLSMPFPPLNQPSMALGLLKPALRQNGISVTTLYPCLWFAEEIGLDLYSFISDTKQEFLVGEWVFAGVAFPDFHPDHDTYLDAVLSAPVSRGLLRKSRFEADPRGALLDARAAAPAFIESAARRVLALRPRIVGCTSTFMQHGASLAMLRKIRELSPDVVTMIGGANCEGEMGVTAARLFPWLDFVVSGEADLLFPELCRKVLESGKSIPASALPAGVVTRNVSCVVFGGEAPRASVQEMDKTPVPDFDDYFKALEESSLRRFISPGLAIETSRGCWWGKVHHCTFCGLNGGNMNFRSKSPARVFFELEHLSDRHQIRRFNVVDNILDLEYIRTLLPRLATPRPYTLFFETKSNLKREQLKVIAAAGIRRLQPGIENMHDEVLRLIDKGTTGLQNVRLLKWARELGIFITWNFLWDVPGEKDEWYAEMADWMPSICHLQPPGVDRIQFHRFSPYHQRPASFGLSLEPYPAYSSVYPFPPERLRELAYYFQDQGRPTAKEELESRPHLKRVMRVLAGWNRLWGQGGMGTTGEQPLLLMHEERDFIRLTDTRPGAVAETHLLYDLPRRVYRLCDDIQTPGSLLKALAQDGGPAVAENELSDAIAELNDRRLLVALNGKILGLGLREVTHIPDSDEDFPGGVTDVESWKLEYAAEKPVHAAMARL
ncbi:MAG TPA: RiPP maturation radical SAM C-methyltransferase [Bryobacteraceae bacterium]|nr:RiPP maturation radical SAM C-methyltransferase [Bryobacteraceae bacterium]